MAPVRPPQLPALPSVDEPRVSRDEDVRLRPTRTAPRPLRGLREWPPYMPLRVRVSLCVALALLWTAFSTWLALPWIRDLGTMIGSPAAIALILGIAILPGYLNAHLVAAIMLDRPRKLRLDVPLPRVALLIAAYDEEDCIGEAIAYALRSDYPSDIEVVVIDDGSSDRTAEIVLAAAAADPRVRLLRAAHGGKSGALNAGLATVDAPVVASIDADTLLMPWSLKRAVARLEQSPPDTVAIAGSVLVRNSRVNVLTRSQEWDYFLGIAAVKRQQSLLRGTLVAQGAFSVYRTKAVRAAGGWPDMIGEDIVLTWSMLQSGGRTGYEPSAIAFTDVPDNMRDLVRQRRRWARGMIEGLRIHGWSLLRRGRLYSHAIAVNWLFPLLDLAVTVAFLPGIVLALTGNFAIVGPMTIAVLPLNAIAASALLHRQRQVFNEVSLRVRRNRYGLLCYFFLYQFISSPVSVLGYTEEILRRRRRW